LVLGISSRKGAVARLSEKYTVVMPDVWEAGIQPGQSGALMVHHNGETKIESRMVAMKKLILTGLVGAVLLGSSAAQTGNTASEVATQGQNPNALASGTIISVDLTKSLDARKAKTGDTIECKLPADVLAHGKIVIPRDSKIIGHITDVKAHSKDSKESKVAIAFDRIVMKKGSEMPIQVAVQAVGRPLQLVDSPAHMNEGAGVPSGASSTAGGTGATSPSRAQERVASIPTSAAGMDSDTPPPTTMAPLGPTSKGMVGIKGMTLETSGKSAVISSEKDNVHLDSGAQVILVVQ
jgi:hypothetical protein